MATLEWHCRRMDGVTLVELLVESDVEARVRIESVLEPVWPPRRYGLPAEGWNDASYEGIVCPERRLLLGYATPAEPVDPPAKIASTEPGVETSSADRLARARGIVRALGTARPARDVVHGTTVTDSVSSSATDSTTADGRGSGATVEDTPQGIGSTPGPAAVSSDQMASSAADGEPSQSHDQHSSPSDSRSFSGQITDTHTASDTGPEQEVPGNPRPADSESRDDCGAISAGESRESLNCSAESPPVDTIDPPDSTADPHPDSVIEICDKAETGSVDEMVGSVETGSVDEMVDSVETGNVEEKVDSVETGSVPETGGDHHDTTPSPEKSPRLSGSADTGRLTSDGNLRDTHSDPADPSLAAIERRVTAAEHLAAVTTVREAREAIQRFGGIGELRVLQTDLARDRKALRRAATRQQSLAARLETIEIPLTVLERLA